GRRASADIAHMGILRRRSAASTHGSFGAGGGGGAASAGAAGVGAGAGAAAAAASPVVAGAGAAALSPERPARRALLRARRCSGISVNGASVGIWSALGLDAV